MLRPVDPDTLSANARFGTLYQDLCNNKLNPDGTSKLDAKAQRDRDGLSEVFQIPISPAKRRSLDSIMDLKVIFY